ncbi:Mu transposase C-terminal domain-containing protein [Nocardia cyriacigeorgica]|uniref:Mu transposase C-terminal domain-containing protein n=1 Tax=Nocardia cyriacigeorgica TaxID=135487 RepID=UPI0018958556|nr:Mu transposase C-terminal domain-containing protein [Nocardia cyriacigeorgica]MBF6412944.1 DDE-type integrase/transposase/recombinase [Nocardia cyriacigeorgica]
MRSVGVRVGVGTRFVYDGETVEVVQFDTTSAGAVVTLRMDRGQRLVRIGLRELLDSPSARVIPDSGGPSSRDLDELASVALDALSKSDRALVRERAGHVREVLTGYRSGNVELAAAGEPRHDFDPALPLSRRYSAKADEVGVTTRTVQEWVSAFRAHGEAGLAPKRTTDKPGFWKRTDQRWVEVALEVMAEHTDQSRPSRTMVINRTNARVKARFGDGAVALPSRATAFRIVERLEELHPTFVLSTKRNRDIAARTDGVYGKLRPTRPGEYVLMDTTRLDVFALDPATLQWMQAELTVAMDWYTRCVVGLRVTPVSTKSVDAAATLYQAFRPRPAGKNWPAEALWPEHGIPRSVLVDVDAIDGPIKAAAGPSLVPETIVIDHGKIFVSEHLTSVCRRMGISIQPARLRTGRDKGPVERFFRTLREDLLQALPGYKGPDVHSRGLCPESEAFFYLDELEAIIREWVAVEYHRRPHASLFDPHLPALKISPAMMFEHGVARAGYIEVPRDPDLAFEFLKAETRTIQHYGIDWDKRVYKGEGLRECYDDRSILSAAVGRRWPIHVDPDDITRVYVRDRHRIWHILEWEHAQSMDMPLSEDAMHFARRLAAAKYTYPDDRVAVADLLERWNLGLGSSLEERRMALRMSREQNDLLLTRPVHRSEAHAVVTQLPSVARVLAASRTQQADHDESVDSAGDTDEFDDLASSAGVEDRHDPGGGFDLDDFYADALEDV